MLKNILEDSYTYFELNPLVNQKSEVDKPIEDNNQELEKEDSSQNESEIKAIKEEANTEFVPEKSPSPEMIKDDPKGEEIENNFIESKNSGKFLGKRKN